MTALHSLPAALFLLTAALLAPPASATDYELAPQEIAPGVYVMWGAQEEVSPGNGANIANIGFIIGEDAVLAVDTGPTRLFAEQMLRVIRAHTDRPLRYVVVTHHHFDHAFGIPVFRDAGAEVVMHRGAASWLAREGEQILQNITRLAGAEWMAGTDIGAADRLIEADMVLDLGARPVDIIVRERGHTAGDLMIMDRNTGTLFAGDLVFNGRVPSLPHGDATIWQAYLAEMASWPWRRLVPGHGPLITEPAPLLVLADYLGFVRDHVTCAWQRGDSRAEALLVELPEPHASLALVQREFQRSVFQLWRKFETSAPAPPCP